MKINLNKKKLGKILREKFIKKIPSPTNSTKFMIANCK
jgi:hypothetical protein